MNIDTGELTIGCTCSSNAEVIITSLANDNANDGNSEFRTSSSSSRISHHHAARQRNTVSSRTRCRKRRLGMVMMTEGSSRPPCLIMDKSILFGRRRAVLLVVAICVSVSTMVSTWPRCYCHALLLSTSNLLHTQNNALLSSTTSSSSTTTASTTGRTMEGRRSSMKPRSSFHTSSSSSTTTALGARRNNNNRGGGGGQSGSNSDPREFFQVQQALQADLRLAEQRQERLQREIQDAKQRQRRLRAEARRRQDELDQMRRRGVTRSARRLAREGPSSGLDRERILLEQELEEIRIRETNQRTSRRLGTLGGLAIAAGALWNFVTEPDGIGSTSSITYSSSSTVKSSTASLAGNNPQTATLPYLEKKIEQARQDLGKSKEDLEKERIRGEEQMAIKKAESEREFTQKKAQQAQDAARLKAEQEKEAARRKAELEKEAARVKAEQEAKAAKLNDEQKTVELKKAEDNFREKKVQLEKDATRIREEQAKEAARVKAEQEKEMARVKTEREAAAKNRVERELAEKKKVVESEQKLLTELEANKKKITGGDAGAAAASKPAPAAAPPAAKAPAPAPKPPAPSVDGRKASDDEAAKIRQIAQQASEKKKKDEAAAANKADPKSASKTTAATTTSPKGAPKTTSPKSDVNKEVKKVINNGNKAVKNARKKADGWWSKRSAVEKNKVKAAVALSAGAATIAGVNNGLRDGTWSSNPQGVAGRWLYSPYVNYNRARRRPTYGRSVDRYGGGGPTSGLPGQGRTARSGSRIRGNVNGLGNRSYPAGLQGATGGPVLGDDQQDLFSARGGVFGGSSNSQNQGYQNDMYSKLRRDQRGRGQNQKNRFQFKNPFARSTSSSQTTGRGRRSNNFQTPTRNVKYNTDRNINVNARGTPTPKSTDAFGPLSSPQAPPGGIPIAGRSNYASGFSPGQNQNSIEKPGGFTPPSTQARQNRMQQPGGFTPPGSQSSQSQFQNSSRRQTQTGGRPPIPRQTSRSNQRQQTRFSNRTPAANARDRSPLSNQIQGTNGPGQGQSSPFSNQNRGGNNRQSRLGSGFSAGNGPTGGRVPGSGLGNPASGANMNRSRSSQRQGAGLGQGFAAGNGPTGGRVPASSFTNPFSSNSVNSRSSTGRLGRGFSPGNGSTGGNKIPVNGVADQGINGFSPFGGRRNPTSTTGSQNARGTRTSTQPQGQRNTGGQSSPFGGSPGGATAGFSPFGGNSNVNNGSTNVAPVPGARFGSNGSPPGRQQKQQRRGQTRYGSGGINGAGFDEGQINGVGYGGTINGATGFSGINGASQQQSAYTSGRGFSNKPSNPLTPPGTNDFEQRRAQEQARRLEEARKEGIAEARLEAQRRRQSSPGRFGRQSRGGNGPGTKLNKALQNAIRSSDEAYKPPQVILDSASIGALLEQVDGPNLYQYDETEKTYSGRAVKVMGESSLDVPIRISAPGSIVEYTIEKKSYDFNLGITAKLDQGGTAVVKETAPFDGRQDRSKTITDQVLVGAGSVPCTLNFKFENKYTWILEVTYRIRVIPPPRDTLIQGRRRRTQAAIKSVETDLSKLRGQQSAASRRRNQLENEVTRLQNQLQSKYGAAATPVGRGY